MPDIRQIAHLKPRPISRAEYDRMVELGFFEEERIELLRGVIVEMSPQGVPHAGVIELLNMLLVPKVAAFASVRVQSALAAADDSEPEPDLAVVSRVRRRTDHPSTALLVIEVADSSLRKDRGVKPLLYAEAEVVEYWVVDLRENVVEVYRDPSTDGYRALTTYHPGDTIEPVALRGIQIAVDDFLPEA